MPAPSGSGAPAPPAPAAAGRIRAIDWHRGLAVLVMIECHAMVFIAGEHRQGPLFDFLNGINGLVAPSFLFAAGFSLSLVLGRTSADPAARRRRFKKSFFRILEVLLVANLMRIMYWPALKEPSWWLRVDIISCIAYGLLILYAVLWFLGRRPGVAVAALAGLAVLVFGLAPMLDALRGPQWWVHLVNGSTGSPFPLFPWIGHVFLGAAIGTLAARPSQEFEHAQLALWGMLILGTVMALTSPALNALNPGTDHWLWSNTGERVAKVAAIALFFIAIERFGTRYFRWSFNNPLMSVLAAYGANGLTAFFWHICFLYYDPIYQLTFGRLNVRTSLAHHWGARCGWQGFWTLTAVLWGMTYIMCRIVPPIEERIRARIAGKPPAGSKAPPVPA